MLIKLIFCCFLASAPLICASQWSWLEPYTDDINVKSIDMIVDGNKCNLEVCVRVHYVKPATVPNANVAIDMYVVRCK